MSIDISSISQSYSSRVLLYSKGKWNSVKSIFVQRMLIHQASLSHSLDNLSLSFYLSSTFICLRQSVSKTVIGVSRKEADMRRERERWRLNVILLSQIAGERKLVQFLSFHLFPCIVTTLFFNLFPSWQCFPPISLDFNCYSTMFFSFASSTSTNDTSRQKPCL